jgi:hypothetical protein
MRLVVLVAAGVMSSFAASAQQPSSSASSQPLSPTVIAQIEALILEKETRTPTERKIDSQLLYADRMRAGLEAAPGVPRVEADVPFAPDGHAVVDVKARITDALMNGLAELGAEVLSSSVASSTLQLHIPLDRVEAIAALDDVIFIQPRQQAATSRMGGDQQTAATGSQQPNVFFTAPTGVGSRSSEGDVAHLAVAARAAFGTTGAGVRIGVLSDGVRNLAASQAAGDLGPVTVLPGQTGSGDEGTAMLEIIHDLAPDAELYFATAMTSITSFAANIRALRDAGCTIIVDDVNYFVESPFQDGQAPGVISNTNGGVVSQAVKDVTSTGVLYFSAAGNSGNLTDGTSGVWEGNFADGGPVIIGTSTYSLHNFGGQTFNQLLAVPPNPLTPISLYWSDPLGGSANDYDLFRLNAAGTAVAASSTNIQNGFVDPYEQVSQNLISPLLIIVKKASAAPRFLHLNTNRGRLQIATSGTTHGHAAVDAEGAYGIAATSAAATFPSPFTGSSTVQPFSADGPRRIFFNADGSEITPGNVLAGGGKVLQKPDFTAADDVSVTGVGGFTTPFVGTSAAAPHAAAIAALLKSASPALTQAQVRSALAASAIDIEAPGVDRDAGGGIIMANRALLSAGLTGTAAVFIDRLQVTDNPGNANGFPEAGEGVKLTIPLANFGAAAATAVSATLRSATPGITITQPVTAVYPDLPVAAVTPNSSPLLFTIASDFPCPRSATFELSIQYAGGPSPRVFTFDIPVGPAPTYKITTTLDGVAPAASPGVTTTTGVQNVRLIRDGIGGACGAPKPLPGLQPNAAGPTHRQFEAYTFDTCAVSAPSCVTVTLEGTNAINLFTAAYSPTFNPLNVQENYKADPGTSAASRTFSFDLPGGPQRFAIGVHDVPQGLATPSGTAYTLTVSGACLGACAPPNQLPVARATDVTVIAGDTCTASASVDNESSDPDGDALTITQSPAGPYPLGTTSVLLTVTDPRGATSQATGTVTVVDRTGPVLTNVAASPERLVGDDNQLASVTIEYDVMDNCGGASCTLSVKPVVLSDENRGGPGNDRDKDPLFQILDGHRLRLRAVRGMRYEVTVTCVDAAGNTTAKTINVDVVKRRRDRDWDDDWGRGGGSSGGDR